MNTVSLLVCLKGTEGEFFNDVSDEDAKAVLKLWSEFLAGNCVSNMVVIDSPDRQGYFHLSEISGIIVIDS